MLLAIQCLLSILAQGEALVVCQAHKPVRRAVQQRLGDIAIISRRRRGLHAVRCWRRAWCSSRVWRRRFRFREGGRGVGRRQSRPRRAGMGCDCSNGCRVLGESWALCVDAATRKGKNGRGCHVCGVHHERAMWHVRRVRGLADRWGAVPGVALHHATG